MKRVFLAILVLFCATPAWADVVYLANGRVLSGVQTEAAGTKLRVFLPDGSLLLRSQEVTRVERTAPPPTPSDARRAELKALADAVTRAWRDGDDDLARRLLASHPLARELSAPGVRTEARLVKGEGGLRLKVEVRRDGGDPRLLALPPGTRAGGSSGVVLLRPAVLVIGPGQRRAQATLPVAWADLTARPRPGPLRLTRARGGNLRRLLAVLCAGDDTPDEVSAQLAVWLLRDGLRPGDLVSFGPRLTVSRRLVLPLHGGRAARLLRAAGLDPQRLGFFRAEPLPSLPPSAPAKAGESSS
jgi:hypothetical protein